MGPSDSDASEWRFGPRRDRPQTRARRNLFYDQVKAYSPGHVVAANDVRAIFGVVSLHQNVSKAVITTTATFAPCVHDEMKPQTPSRRAGRQRLRDQGLVASRSVSGVAGRRSPLRRRVPGCGVIVWRRLQRGPRIDVWSTPLRLTNLIRLPSLSASMRHPSTFSSNTQPSRWKGSRTSVGAIGTYLGTISHHSIWLSLGPGPAVRRGL
jgi:hypothetical protein